MRSVLASLTDCRYEDQFDWSVYDRIASKFEEAPRGGAVFNTTFKLVNHHSSCTKCHHAFEIDTYGRGCVHNCVYCYAKERLTARGYWNRPQPFPVNLAEIRKTFYTVFETNKSSVWRSIMERRVPIRIGSMSDSFMWMDTKYGVTKEFLRILSYYNYPYIVFTRSDLVAHDDYLALLRKDLCSVQFSISGNNNRFTRLIEPGAPSYERRLKALEKLADHKFWTTVRINPLFPKYPDGYFTDRDAVIARFGSREKIPQLPFYTDSFVAELADARVPSLLAGFVRLSPFAIKDLSKASGVDVNSFFRSHTVGEGDDKRADKRYSDAEISYYYRWFHQECRKHDVRFSTCYIGNGIKDYFQYQRLWSNSLDCCDAVGNVKAFASTSQIVPWEERRRHASCKTSADASRAMEAEAERSLSSERQTDTSRKREQASLS